MGISCSRKSTRFEFLTKQTRLGLKDIDSIKEYNGISSKRMLHSYDECRDLLFKLPGGNSGEMEREMESVERIRAGPQQGGKRPEDMTPQELHSVLWQVLTFRDSVVKKIDKTIGT